MDTDTAPSFAVEFEKLLLQKHCWELIDETHVQRIFHYGCQYDPPGQLDHVCLTDWEDKVNHCFDMAYENTMRTKRKRKRSFCGNDQFDVSAVIQTETLNSVY